MIDNMTIVNANDTEVCPNEECTTDVSTWLHRSDVIINERSCPKCKRVYLVIDGALQEFKETRCEMDEGQMKALFLLAGFEVESTYKLVNEYYSDPQSESPWWLVKTEFGLIKIGWRKRVINIDWSDTDYKSGVSKFYDDRPIDKLTTDETTNWETGVHAWSYGKAVDYLSTLHLRLRQCGCLPPELPDHAPE